VLGATIVNSDPYAIAEAISLASGQPLAPGACLPRKAETESA
jgi:hypothetical protein